MPDPKKKIDFMSLSLLGTTKEEAQKEGYEVIPMSYEDSFEVNKPLLGDIGAGTYKMMHDKVYAETAYGSKEEHLSRMAGNATSTDEVEPIIQHDKRRTFLAHPNLLGLETTRPHKMYERGATEGEIGQYYDKHGKLQDRFTDEQMAEIRNVYLKPDGNYGDLNDYQNMDVLGSPFRYDENGRKKTLVLDPSSKLWVEHDGDDVLSSYGMRSISGPKEASSGIGENIATQSYNTVVDQILGSSGTIVEAMGNLGKFVTGSDDPNSWMTWGREMQNYAAGIKSKVSEAVEQEGMFGSWRAGLGTAANALTQVGMQAFVGLLSGGVGNMVSGASKGATALKWAAQGAPWAFGSAYAMQAMNEEAKSAGLDDDSRMFMSFFAGATAFASEKILSSLGAKGIADMFDDPEQFRLFNQAMRGSMGAAAREGVELAVTRGGVDDTVRAAMTQRYLNEMGQVAEQFGIDLTQKTKGNIAQRAAQNIGRFLNYDKNPTGFMGRFKGMIAAGTEEGLEENIEGALNNWGKYIYNEGFANKDAEPGKGKFENTSHDWGMTLGEFAAGFIGGGAMGVLRGVKKRPDVKNYGVANLATSMSEEDGEKFLLNLHRNGQFGNPAITTDGQFISSLPEDQRKAAQSMNDIGYQQMREQLRTAHEIKRLTGMNDPEFLSKVMGGDNTLMRDAIASMLHQRTVEDKRKTVEQQYNTAAQVDPNGAEATALKKELDDLTDEVKTLSQLNKEYVDGTAVEKYNALMLVRAMELAKKRNKTNFKDMSQEERKKVVSSMLQEAEQTDSWTNREKAVELVQKVKEYNKKYKDEKDRVAAMRKDGEELLRMFDMSGDVSKENIDAYISTIDSFVNPKTGTGKALTRSQHGKTVKQLRDQHNKDLDAVAEEMFQQTEVQDYVKAQEDEIFNEKEAEYNKTKERKGRSTTKSSTSQRNRTKTPAFDADAARAEAKAEAEERGRNRVSTIFDTDDFMGMTELETKYRDTVTNLGKRGSKLYGLQQAIYDDTDKMFVYGSGRINETGQDIFFGTFNEPTDDRFTDDIIYSAIDKDGKVTKTTAEAYDTAKQKGKPVDGQPDTYEYNGLTYSAVPTQAQGFSDRVVNFEVGNTRTTQDGIMTTHEGVLLSQGNDYQGAVIELMKKLASMQGEATPDIVKAAEELAKLVDNDIDAIETMLYLNAHAPVMSDKIQTWLGFDQNGRQAKDLYAHLLNLQNTADVLDQLRMKMNGQTDVREQKFERLRRSTLRMNAHITMDLREQMRKQKVEVNGVELIMPDHVSPDAINDDSTDEAVLAYEAAVIKQMQFWHYFFQNAKNRDAIIEDLKILWHKHVFGMKVELDASGKPVRFLNEPNDPNIGMYTMAETSKAGMDANDFDKLLDFDNFSHKSFEKESSEHGGVRQLMYYHSLNLMFNGDLRDMYTQIQSVLDKPGSTTPRFEGAHTQEQLFVLLPMITHVYESANIRNRSQSKSADDISWLTYHRNFKNILKGGAVLSSDETKTNTYPMLYDENTGEPTGDMTHILDNWFLVTGTGGAGKTSFLTHTALRVAHQKGFLGKKIILIAPNATQVDLLVDSVKQAGFDPNMYEAYTVDEFVAENGKSDRFQGMTIIMDEVSMMSPQQRLDLFLRGIKMPTLKDFTVTPGSRDVHSSNTVFILGDEYQSPLDANTDNISRPASEWIQHGFNMTQVKRSRVQGIFFLQADFRRQINKGKQAKGKPKLSDGFVYHIADDGTPTGVQLFQAEQEFFDKVKERTAKGAVLIVYNETDLAKAVAAGIPSDSVRVQTDVNKTAQGQTIDEVYVYMSDAAMANITKNSQDYYRNRYLGTAVGRGKNYVGLYVGDASWTGKISPSKQVSSLADIPMFAFDTAKEQEKKEKLYKRYDAVLAKVPAVNKTKEAQKEETKEKSKEQVKETTKEEPKVEAPVETPTVSDNRVAKTEKELQGFFNVGDVISFDGKTGTVTFKLLPRSNDLFSLMLAVKGDDGFAYEVQYNFMPSNPKGYVSTSVKRGKNKEEAPVETPTDDSLAKRKQKFLDTFAAEKAISVKGLGASQVKEIISYTDDLAVLKVFTNGKEYEVQMAYDKGEWTQSKVTPLYKVDDETQNEVHPQEELAQDDDLDGGTPMVDTTEVVLDEAPPVPKTEALYEDVSIRVGGVYYITDKFGTTRQTEVTALEKAEDGTTLVRDGKGVLTGIEAFAQSVRAYREQWNTTSDFDRITSDTAMLLQYGRLSVTNYYSDSPNRAQRIQEFSDNLTKALAESGRSSTIELKVVQGGAYYDRKGDEKQAAYMIYIMAEGLTIGMIPLRSASNEEALEGEHADANLYYKQLRVFAEDMFAKHGDKPFEMGVVNLKAALGSSIRSAATGNRTKYAAIKAQVEARGGRIDKIEQVKTKDGRYTNQLFMSFFNGAVQETLEMDSAPLDTNYLDTLDEAIAALDNAVTEEQADKAFEEYQKLMTNYWLSGLSADINNGSGYALGLVNDGVLVKELDAEKDPVMNATGTIQYKLAYTKGAPLTNRNTMVKVLKAVRKALDEQIDTMTLRTPILINTENNDVMEASRPYMMTASPAVTIDLPKLYLPIGEKILGGGLAMEEDADDKVIYDMALADAYSEFSSILGDDMSFVEATSKNFHGLVSKLGTIFVTARDGNVSSRAMYHEIAHYVAEFLLPRVERNALYAEIAKRMGKADDWETNPVTRRKVAERWAELADRFTADRRNLTGFSKFAQQMFDFLKRFMAKIGLIKDLTFQYLYDIYVDKKYKGMAPLFESLEDIYDEGLYLAKNFANYQPVVDHFGDHDVARRATQTVNVIMSEQIIRPNLNSRMFKDKDISFKDMINRVEYSMRSRVMFETDDNGSIRLEGGQPVLRTDANGRGFMVKNKKQEDVELFRYENSYRYPDGTISAVPVLLYFDDRSQTYQPAPINNKGVYFATDGEKKYIRGKLREALMGFKVNTTLVGEGLSQSPIFSEKAENKEALKSIARTKDKRLYEVAATLKDDVLLGMMQRSFPGVEVKDIFYGHNKNYTKISDILDQLIEAQDTVARKETNEVSPFDRMSTLMHFAIQTIPKVTRMPLGSGAFYYAPTDKVVNYELAQNIMQNVMMMHYNPMRSTVESFRENLRGMIEQMEKGLNFNDINQSYEPTEEYLTAVSIYNMFFETGGRSNPTMSHYRFLNWHNRMIALEGDYQGGEAARIYNEYTMAHAEQKRLGILASTDAMLPIQEFFETLPTRAAHANNLLNAVTTHFGSIARDKNIKVSVYGDADKASSYVSNIEVGTVDERKKQLGDNLNGNLIDSDGNIARSFKNLFGFNEQGKALSPDGSRPAYTTIETDGIYYNNKRSSVKVIGFENGRLVPMNNKELSKFIEQNGMGSLSQAIMSMFNELYGIKLDRRVAQHLSMMGNTADTDSKEFKTRWNNFHNMFAPVLLSAYMYSAERIYGEQAASKAEHYSLAKNILDTFVGSDNSYGKTTDSALADINDDQETKENVTKGLNKEGRMFYYPTEFYEQIADLAAAEVAVKGTYGSAFGYTVGDKRIYLDTVQGMFGYRYHDKGFALVRDFAQRIRTEKARNINHLGGRVINPYLGQVGFVDRYGYVNGYTKNGRGVELDKLSARDNYDIAMDMFMADAGKSDSIFAMKAPFVQQTNHGDRSQQLAVGVNLRLGGYAAVSPRSNGLMIKTTNKEGEVSFDLDADNITTHLMNNYLIGLKAQAVSMNKWVNFFMGKGIVIEGAAFSQADIISDIEINTPRYTDKRDAVYNKIVTAIRSVENILHLQDDATMPDPDYPVQLYGTDLIAGKDFIVIKDSKASRGGIVQLGYDTTFLSDVRAKGRNEQEAYYRSMPTSVIGNNMRMVVQGGILDGETLDVVKLATSMDENGDVYHTKKDGTMVKLDKGTKEAMLYYVFQGPLRDTHSKTKKAKYKLYQSRMYGNQKLTKGNQSVTEREGIKVNENDYYTPWAAYVIGHWLENMYETYSTEGTLANHMDHILYRGDNGKFVGYTTNANKRFASRSSTFQVPNIGGYWDIDAVTTTLHIGEPFTTAESYSEGEAIENSKHSSQDGSAQVNMMHAYLMWKSMGSEYGSMNNTGNIKTVTVQSETGNIYKHALDRPSYQSMMMQPEQRLQQEIMLNPRAMATIPAVAVRTYKDITGNGYDSLWQWYTVFENDSVYAEAIKQMEESIARQGGIDAMVRQGIADDDARVRSFMVSMQDRNELTKQFYYDELVAMLRASGFDDLIVQPARVPSSDYAIDQLAEHYAKERAIAKIKGLDISQRYPYISHIQIKDASVKRKAQIIPIPVHFKYAGNSLPTITPDGKRVYHNNYTGMTAPVPIKLQGLSTMSGQVPFDLFSAYMMHKEEGGGTLDLSGYTMPRDNSEEGIQLNPNRSYDDTMEAPMIQMLSVIMATPSLHENGDALLMMEAFADLMRTALDSIEEEKDFFANKMDEEERLSATEESILQAFLKEKVKPSLTRTNDSSMLSVIIADGTININVAEGVKERMFQYLASYIRKEVVKRKAEAMRLVQASGMMVELYDFTHEDGRTETFTMLGAMKHASLTIGISQGEIAAQGLQSFGFTPRMLKQTRITLNPNFEMTPEMEAMQAQMGNDAWTKELIKRGAAIIEPGEAILPASKFAKYDIPKDMTLNDLWRIYYHDGDAPTAQTIELYSMATKEGREELIRTLSEFVRNKRTTVTTERKGRISTQVSYNGNLRYGENPYFDTVLYDGLNKWLKANEQKVKDIQKQAKQELKEEAGDVDTFLAKYFDGENGNEAYRLALSAKVDAMLLEAQEDTIDKLIEHMADGMIAVRLTTEDTLNTRTPSGPGSTFIANVPAVINDNGSTGYVNTIKNEIDGSDQDVDQFTSYKLSDTLEERGYSQAEIAAQMAKWRKEGNFSAINEETLGNINNRMIRLLQKHYKNPSATHMTMSPIAMDAIKKAAEVAQEQIFTYGDEVFSFGMTVTIRRMAHDGKAVGGAANTQKGQTALVSSYWLNGSDGLNTDFIPMTVSKEAYKAIPGRVEGLVNAATDNQKLLLLGAINVNMGNVSTVANALFAGQEIIDHVKANPERFGLIAGQPISDETAIYEFFKGEAYNDVFSYLSARNSTIDGLKPESYFHAFHNYISKLTERTQTNKDKQVALQRDLAIYEGEVEQALQSIFTEQELATLYEQVLGSDGQLMGNKVMAAVMGMARKKTKANYSALRAVINAEINNKLIGKDKDLRQNILAELEKTRKTYVEEAAGVYDLIEGERSEQVAAAVEKAKANGDQLMSLVMAMRKYREAERQLKTVSKKLDENYRKELMLGAKATLFSDWMDRWVQIVAINQFQITSEYDAYTFANNVRYMTGFTLDELVGLAERYNKEKSEGETATAFLERINRKLSQDSVKNTAMDMYKHRNANNDNSYLTDTLEAGGMTINYLDDFFSIGDVAPLIIANPVLVQQLAAANKLMDWSSKMFYTSRREFQGMMDTMLDETAQDIFGERKYRSFKQGIAEQMMGEFLASPEVAKLFNNTVDKLGLVEGGVTKPMVGAMFAAQVPAIDKKVGREAFIMQFPTYFEQVVKPRLISMAAEGKLNEQAAFLVDRFDTVTKGIYNYVIINYPTSVTPEMLDDMREGYRGLPQEVQDILALYQLAKDGFNSGKGAFLSRVLPEKYYRMYSSYLENKYDGIPIPKGTTDFYKEMLLSQPHLNLARKARNVKQGGKWTQLPPIGAHGYAKYYIESASRTYNAFGKRDINVLSKIVESDFTGFGYSVATTPSRNIIPAVSILDKDSDTVTGMGKDYHGISLDGLKLGAYYNFVIRGGLDRMVDQGVKQFVKERGLEPTQDELKAIIKGIVDIKKLNDTYYAEYSKKTYNRDEELKTPEEITKKVTEELYDLVKEALTRKYKGNEEAFNAIVRDSKGKVITDRMLSEDRSFGYSMSMLFNKLSTMEGSPYSNISAAGGFAFDGVEVSYSKKMYRARMTGIGLPWTRPGLNSMYITEIDNYSREALGKKLGWGTNSAYLSEDAVATIILDAYNAMDPVAIINKHGSHVIDTVANALGIEGTKEEKAAAIVQHLKENTGKWQELNITNERASQHITDLTIRGGETFRIDRKNAHPLRVGDIVYLRDGFDGVVTAVGSFDKNNNPTEYYYKLNYNSLNEVKVYRAVTSLENRVADNNARRTLESFVRSLAQAIDVPYRFITQEQSAEMGQPNAASFYAAGTVFINLDRADSAVAIHEFSHPLVLALEHQRPDLYNVIAQQVMANEEVMNYVRLNYPELSTQEDMLREAIPTYIQMRYYAREYYSQSQAERQAWDNYWQWLNSTFAGAMTEQQSLDTSLASLDMKNATLNDIADAIINDLKSEKAIPYLSSLNYTHAVPYIMRASSSSKMKNFNIRNLDQLFQTKAYFDAEKELRDYTRSVIKGALTSGHTYQGMADTYNFAHGNPKFHVDGKFSQQKWDEEIERAVTLESKFMGSAQEKLLSFLNQTKGSDALVTHARETLFPSWTKRYKLEKAETSAEVFYMLEEKVRRMLIEINFNPETDVAMTMTEALAAMKIVLPTNIQHDNPMVIFHNRGKADESISILSITTGKLTATGAHDKQALGDAYADKDQLNKKDKRHLSEIRLSNTNQDINSVKNTLLAMAISKARPETKINRVGTVQILGWDSAPIAKHFKEIEDMLPQVEKLFKVSVLRDTLERDLYDLISDESLYDPERYRTEAFTKLEYYLRSALGAERKEGTPVNLQKALDALAAVKTDHLQAAMPTLAKSIKARLDYLRIEVLGNDKELVALSKEYQDLASIYMVLTGYNEVNTLKVTPIDYLEKWIGTADRWSGKVRTWVFDSLDRNFRKAKEELMPFQEEINTWAKTLNTLNPSVGMFKDNAHNLFKNLFKKIKVKDIDGKEVEVSTHEIHYDRENKETAEALANGTLSETELAFGKWLSDKMYDEFVSYVMSVERSLIAESIDESEESLRAKAKVIVDSRYRKGMMPVFVQTAGSALSEGKLKEAVELFTSTAGRWYGGNLFDEYEQSAFDKDGDGDYQKGAFAKLLSPFWTQFSNVLDMGSEERMRLLGLGRDANGNIVQLNGDRQKTLSFNLTNIGLFSMAASMRSKHLKEGVANVNIALDILRGENMQKGAKVDDIISQIENYVNRHVYGNLPDSGKLQVLGAAINVDNMLDASGKLLHMAHLAFGGVLGAKNMSSQALKLLTNALVNAATGSNMFSVQHLPKALSEVITNPKKVELINRKYQVVNISERDLLNHFKNNITKGNVYESDFQMFFHWFGDHYTQLIGMVAQMMQDGTWDAHDAEGNYDPSKDKRFEGKEGQMIKEEIMRQQFKEEYHVPINGHMTHAYTQRLENNIKVVLQRYVSELNDNQYKNMVSSFGLARAAFSLKTYMFNVAQHWWKERYADVSLGGYKVMGEEGKEKVVYEAKMVEGVIQTMAYAFNQLRQGEKVVLDEYRKRNLLHVAATMGVITAMYFLVDLLSEGFDDDDDKRTKKDESLFYGQRLLNQLFSTGYNIRKEEEGLAYWQQMTRYIIGGAANEQLSYSNPLQIVKEWQSAPNPYLWQVKNIQEVFWGTLLLPKSVQEEGTAKALDEWAYNASKTAPLVGAPYRTIRQAVQAFMNDQEQ